MAWWKTLSLISVGIVLFCNLAFSVLQERSTVSDRRKQTDTDLRRVKDLPVGEPERKAWEKVEGEKNLKKKSKEAESYLKEFPDGVFAPYAHEIVAVYSHRDNDLKKFFEHAELAVASLPDDVALLSSLAVAYAEQQQPDPAIERGEQALKFLTTMERPAEYSLEVWPDRRDQMMVDAHYGTGTAYLFKAFQSGGNAKMTATAIEHLVSATQIMPKDDRCQFRLGFAYQISGDTKNAILGYARATSLGGANSATARQYLEQAYQRVHGNLDGLDKLIAEQKRYLDEISIQP